MIKLRIWVALAVTTCGLVSAQDVPPPPKPPDDSPSLETTMKFIEEKLGSIGPVNYIVYTGYTNGSERANTFGYEMTKLRASVADCRIDYHWRLTMDGMVLRDKDSEGLQVKDVEEVMVGTAEQTFKESNSKAGHPEWTARVDPPVFEMAINVKKVGRVSFWVYDESLANRIAKALVHAVELCGGGSKDPF